MTTNLSRERDSKDPRLSFPPLHHLRVSTRVNHFFTITSRGGTLPQVRGPTLLTPESGRDLTEPGAGDSCQDLRVVSKLETPVTVSGPLVSERPTSRKGSTLGFNTPHDKSRTLIAQSVIPGSPHPRGPLHLNPLSFPRPVAQRNRRSIVATVSERRRLVRVRPKVLQDRSLRDGNGPT